MNGRFRADPVNRQTFLQILQEPQGITHAMRLMNETSVLGRYLWVFRRIVGQMQHDLFHAYTVDQHILMVLRNVRRFFMAEHAHEYPFCSQLAGGWDKPWILYTAALFHDIAKGRGGDHSKLGCTEVRTFCRQHQIGKEDAQLIEFLVGEHLTMSHVAQKEDLSDPEVIGSFAQRVGSERNLTALYLLTVADIRGTSPLVWNAWKGKLLEDLYRLTRDLLSGEREVVAHHARALEREPRAIGEVQWRHVQAHDWPGNLHELNLYARAFVLGLEDLGSPLAPADGQRSLQQIMADFERTVLEDALRRARGDIGTLQAMLQTPRKTIYDKLTRYQLRPGDFR
jgi:[protein-PII] uridylyltransferase